MMACAAAENEGARTAKFGQVHQQLLDARAMSITSSLLGQMTKVRSIKRNMTPKVALLVQARQNVF
jgi:hypothetical protein